ncbi:MAG TPA: glycosyltransferase family 87 protein, partial [Chloroflexia bacterium]|nr:glycosyltransferase family 87 protein [Chloroflexia bacterium]
MPDYRRFLLPVLYLSLALVSGVSVLQYTAQQFPWDFTINWVAAQGMRQGISLYAHDELRNLSLSLVGPHGATLFQDTYTSYIGLPSTALLMQPFTLLPFADAVTVYQVALLIAFGTSVYLTGLALPPESRVIGWVVGAVALRLFHPVLFSVGLGQVDALVMLSLAIGLLAASKQRWWLAGMGIGVAALLKVSPVLLILYLLLKGKHQAVAGALLTALLLLSLSAVGGRADDLLIFARDVAPSLSAGSLHIQNQSLPGWLARLLSPETDLLTFTHGLGPSSLLGLPSAVAVTIAFYLKTRQREPASLDYGFLILVALLAGPITWDHYTSWAVLPLILLCNTR